MDIIIWAILIAVPVSIIYDMFMKWGLFNRIDKERIKTKEAHIKTLDSINSDLRDQVDYWRSLCEFYEDDFSDTNRSKYKDWADALMRYAKKMKKRDNETPDIDKCARFGAFGEKLESEAFNCQNPECNFNIKKKTNMKIKEGMKLWAISPCVMNKSGNPTLTVGKCYEVKVVVGRTFTVIDDDGRNHYFGIEEASYFFQPYPPETKPETLEQRKERLEKELEQVERELEEQEDEVRIEGCISLLDHYGFVAQNSKDEEAMEVNTGYYAFIEEKNGVQLIKFKKK